MQQQPGSRVADAAGEVAERVRKVVEAAGCSQREFARRIVMDPSKLSRSLSGSRRFTVAELARIADAAEIDAAWLLGSGASADAGAGSGAPAAPEPAPDPAPQTRPASGVLPPAPVAGRPLQIVRETVRLIAEHGFHAVRVSDIAGACDTSTAAIHYHFPGRAELLEAAVRWCMDEDTASRAARLADAAGTGTGSGTGTGEGDAAGELRQLIALQTPRTPQQRRQWLVWLDLWAEAARSTAIGKLHVEYYRQWRTTVADVLRRGIAQGVFRDIDPEAGALRLTALIDGLASQVLASGEGEGTSADDMHEALLAYVETELNA
ncbi:TetR family transcriptional regulator C-terminal domain-containing protein [Streptomyces sp. NPDC048172]|uniref:TetR family transcriptional regulator C-terminal domain-containing protein n=1 Tax=Streptomyces sp. NPDC048172 TaxID=3365505 RepID=UPI00371A7276